MTMIDRESILAADDLPRTTVDCPEWGGTLTVRGMTLGERGRMVTASEAEAPVLAVIAAVIDPDSGKPLFAPSDKAALMRKSPAAIDRLALAIARLSGVPTGEAAEKN